MKLVLPIFVFFVVSNSFAKDAEKRKPNQAADSVVTCSVTSNLGLQDKSKSVSRSVSVTLSSSGELAYDGGTAGGTANLPSEIDPSSTGKLTVSTTDARTGNNGVKVEVAGMHGAVGGNQLSLSSGKDKISVKCNMN